MQRKAVTFNKTTIHLLLFIILGGLFTSNPAAAIGVGAGVCDYIRGNGIHAILEENGGDGGSPVVYTYYTGSEAACIAALQTACTTYAFRRIREIAPTHVSLEDATIIFWENWASHIAPYQSGGIDGIRNVVKKLYEKTPVGILTFYQCFDNLDLPENRVAPEGKPVPFFDIPLNGIPEKFRLDGDLDDWKLHRPGRPTNITPIPAPIDEPSYSFDFDLEEMVDDLRYFYDLFVTYASAITMALLISLLVGFFGAKILETLVSWGALALNPLTLIAAILAVIYLMYDSGLDQYDVEGRLNKYSNLLTTVEAQIDLSKPNAQFKITKELAKLFKLDPSGPKLITIKKEGNKTIIERVDTDGSAPSNVTISDQEMSELIENLQQQGELKQLPPKHL
ncbi:MAG: hypothetical protein R3A45_11100 [Bdellovibrionota bacterium]